MFSCFPNNPKLGLDNMINHRLANCTLQNSWIVKVIWTNNHWTDTEPQFHVNQLSRDWDVRDNWLSSWLGRSTGKWVEVKQLARLAQEKSTKGGNRVRTSIYPEWTQQGKDWSIAGSVVLLNQPQTDAFIDLSTITPKSPFWLITVRSDPINMSMQPGYFVPMYITLHLIIN